MNAVVWIVSVLVALSVLHRFFGGWGLGVGVVLVLAAAMWAAVDVLLEEIDDEEEDPTP